MPEDKPAKRPLTADQLLNSGLIGIWKDREDIGDSAVYARKLREMKYDSDIKEVQESL